MSTLTLFWILSGKYDTFLPIQDSFSNFRPILRRQFASSSEASSSWFLTRKGHEPFQQVLRTSQHKYWSGSTRVDLRGTAFCAGASNKFYWGQCTCAQQQYTYHRAESPVPTGATILAQRGPQVNWSSWGWVQLSRLGTTGTSGASINPGVKVDELLTSRTWT